MNLSSFSVSTPVCVYQKRQQRNGNRSTCSCCRRQHHYYLMIDKYCKCRTRRRTFQVVLASCTIYLAWVLMLLPCCQGFTFHPYSITTSKPIRSTNSKGFQNGKQEIRPLNLFNGGAGSDRNSDNYKTSSLATINASASVENNNNDKEFNVSLTNGYGKTTTTTAGGIAGGLQMQQWYQSNMYNQNSMDKILDELEYGQTAIPITFEMKEKNNISTKKRKIQVRQMEMKDLPRCVALCLKEYGKYSSINDNNTGNGQKKDLKNQFQSMMDDLDNFIFSFVVLFGLEQRVTRRMQSDTSKSLPQDHNVVVISELTMNDEQQKEDELIFGMAEISLQPPDPSRTAPPFVVPTNLKSFFADITSSPVATATMKSSKPPLCAYVSNVLITNEYRSKGYSKILMAACHGIARSWGYESTFLHVDADFKSGRAAQQLYRKLGYKPFVDETYNEQFAWMGIDSVNRGLYIVDGVPLLFLKKDL